MLPAKSPRVARYKHIDTSPRFLAVDLEKQLLPGSLAHAVNHLLDHDVEPVHRPIRKLERTAFAIAA